MRCKVSNSVYENSMLLLFPERFKHHFPSVPAPFFLFSHHQEHVPPTFAESPEKPIGVWILMNTQFTICSEPLQVYVRQAKNRRPPHAGQTFFMGRTYVSGIKDIEEKRKDIYPNKYQNRYRFTFEQVESKYDSIEGYAEA